MRHPCQASCRNRLLRGLNPADFAGLKPHLERETLKGHALLVQPDCPIERVHFVEEGIVSLIGVAADGEQIELGLAGREGLVGTPILLGADRTPHEARVQAPGWAWSITSGSLNDVLRDSAGLRERLLLYVQVVAIQVACTALANGRYKLEQRLARWLLMYQDRVESDALPTKHRLLSLMLGVNRTGVTAAVATFERAGLVETRRGTITIRDRGALLAIAGASYGQPEAEYARLLPESAS